MERQSDGTYIKKGPWTAEEDEVLMNFVKKNGPRGWSSIRSMGLLPRTGKSCRLRWVNKLRPNLKTGCKFSAEEERVVIELQAEFGNKWAQIARYLPGRTDNDVKNFWSARRKRLERILQSPTLKSQKNKENDPMPMMEVPLEQGSTSHQDDQQSKDLPVSISSEEIRMVSLPDLIKPDNLQDSETGFPILDISPFQMIPFIESTVTYSASLSPQLQGLDLPKLPECQDLAPEPIDFNFVSMFKHQEAACEAEYKPRSLTRFPPTGTKGNAEIGMNDYTTPPDSFFDEFPPDMFDNLEPLPGSSDW